MSKQPTYDYQGYELNTEENASFEEKRLVQLSRLLAALEKRKSRIEVMIQFMDPYEPFGEVLDEFNLIDARITQIKDQHDPLRQRVIGEKK